MPKKVVIILAIITFLLAFIIARFWPSQSKGLDYKNGTYITNGIPVALIDGYNEVKADFNYGSFSLPIFPATERITKKPFGIYINPENSPVNPEKFQGYHTGVDFETLASEQDSEVPVFTICTGKLLYKKQVSGYGGVAVQSCNLQDQAVTVLYGHLKFNSITANIGEELKAEHPLGILGQGYGSETDGERKHLHLSVHLGPAVELKGYVQNKAALESWLDPVKYFNKK